MKSTNSWVWALVAILALFLAGCGGGSSNTGAGEMPDPEPTPVEQAQAAYTAAEAAEMAAMAARATAKAQLDAAKLADAYDLYTTGGDSSVVHTNAKVITDAKAAVEKALADAKAEKMKIDEALKALNDVATGTTGLEAQKKVLDQQSKDVAAQIKLIEGYLRTVTGYAAKVDTEAKIKALAGETPAGADNESTKPARRMLYALSEDDSVHRASGGYNGKIMGRYIRTQPPTQAAAVPPTKVVLPATSDPDNTDNTGRSMFYHRYDIGELPAGVMTWEQITGTGNLVKKAFGADNMDVDVLPLAGMPLSSLTDSSGTALTTPPTFTSAGNEQYYKGIKGTLYCQGNCTVDEGKLTGSLYFQKAGEGGSRYYWMEPENSHYTQYGAYVRYGYWLYETGNTTGVKVLSHSYGTTIGDITGAASDALPGTATYKGNALGLSVLKIYTGGEHTGQKSAQFTADVTLNATFGTSAKLSGMVDNFMGNAVDENWSVKLQETDMASVYGYVVNALATGSAGSSAYDKSGRWQAYPFARTGTGRPDGFHGNFNSHFSNGHAVGAFSTRMQTSAE